MFFTELIKHKFDKSRMRDAAFVTLLHCVTSSALEVITFISKDVWKVTSTGDCVHFILELLHFVSNQIKIWSKISTEIFSYVVSLEAGTERVEKSWNSNVRTLIYVRGLIKNVQDKIFYK
jgi:hypothetical protein